MEVDFRDTSGNLLEADEVRVALAEYAHSYTHPYQDWDNQKYYIRMTPGTYAIQMSNSESKTILAKTGVTVAANGTLDFDARDMETEQYTFHLDGVTAGCVLPAGYARRELLGQFSTSRRWRYGHGGYAGRICFPTGTRI